MLSRQPQWTRVLFVIIISRLLLNVPAFVGANLFPLTTEGANATTATGIAPQSLSGMWTRWDSGFYLTLASSGYSLHGKEVAFFPAYPILIKLLSFNQPALMSWAGVLISNIAFGVAGLLLWQQVKFDFDEKVAWATLISLCVFPTALFFSAVYTESLLLLCGVLTYCFTVRQQYGLAGLCVSVAALTRINGFLFALIPLTDIVLRRPPRLWLRFFLIGLASGLGLLAFMLYLWNTQGSPWAFTNSHLGSWRRSIVWPWQTLIDSGRVVLTGYGGNESNWFMRVVSAQDLAATLLFMLCTGLSFFWLPRHLFVYQLSGIIFLLISHGPYAYGLWSTSRYVLGLFPAFIVLGIGLQRLGRWKWLVWGASAAALFFLTAWFANGRWVA